MRLNASAPSNLCLAALLLWLAWANGAQAQTAKELFDQGVQALNAGRHADAATALDQSYRKDPVPAVLYNLGLAYKGLGHPGKAVEAFESYVKYADRKKEGKTIEAAKAEIGKLKSSYARFALKLTPADALIDIDGVRATPNKDELWVATGKHKISVRADGYEAYDQTIDVAAGRFDLEIKLRQPTSPPPERAAALVDEGIALQAAGSLQPALDKYLAAEAIYSTPRGIAQMGLCEEALGDMGPAEQHIETALKAKKDPWIRENRKRLQQARQRLKRQLATLEITGSPDGTEIFVNERSMGKLPLLAPLRVLGGSLIVRGKKEGYSDAEEILQLPARGKKRVKLELSEAPAPIVAPLPVVVPTPAPAQPAVPALAAEPPPPTEPIAPEPAAAPPPEPEKSAQADIEAFADARQDLEGEAPDEARDLATGFEMALNIGYQPWIGGPNTDGSSGVLSLQLVFGARIIWPLSFGVMLTGGYDPGGKDTEFVAALNPGLYVRGHIQQYKRQPGFDAWAGVGIQPLAMQLAPLKAKPIDASMVDLASLDESARADLARNMAGIDTVHTIQSLNVPLELGATLYVTKGFGFDLALGLTFWLPQQDCRHDDKDRLCTSSDLSSQTSLFIGGGITLLP